VTTPVVLDASAGVEILLLTPTGRRLLAKLPEDTEEWVPELYSLRSPRFSAATRSTVATHWLVSAPLSTGWVTAPVRRVQVPPLLLEAWSMRDNLTIADAVYVVMARHLGAPLATTDLRLAATPALGVSTVVP